MRVDGDDNDEEEDEEDETNGVEMLQTKMVLVGEDNLEG